MERRDAFDILSNCSRSASNCSRPPRYTHAVNRRFAFLYVAWIAICATLFAALSGAEDPSRRRDRILSNDAGARAVTIASQRDRRYRGYEAVHVAYAGRGEGGREARWVVLLDRVPHTELHEAIVVELRASDGQLITLREPK